VLDVVSYLLVLIEGLTRLSIYGFSGTAKAVVHPAGDQLRILTAAVAVLLWFKALFYLRYASMNVSLYRSVYFIHSKQRICSNRSTGTDGLRGIRTYSEHIRR
jgi:hypothetical protein